MYPVLLLSIVSFTPLALALPHLQPRQAACQGVCATFVKEADPCLNFSGNQFLACICSSVEASAYLSYEPTALSLMPCR